jgi:hypothetical protein
VKAGGTDCGISTEELRSVLGAQHEGIDQKSVGMLILIEYAIALSLKQRERAPDSK